MRNDLLASCLMMAVCGTAPALAAPETSASPTPTTSTKCYDDVIGEIGLSVCFRRGARAFLVEHLSDASRRSEHEHPDTYDRVVGAPDRGRFAKPGYEGAIVARFDKGVAVGEALFDFYVFEAGEKKEAVKIELSQTGTANGEWLKAGCIKGGALSIDPDTARAMEGEEWQFVKLEGVKPEDEEREGCTGETSVDYPGPDIDAVGIEVISITFFSSSCDALTAEPADNAGGFCTGAAFFDTNRHEIKDDLKSRLQPAVALLGRVDKAIIDVRGFADERGEEAANQDLSRRRAENLAKWLREAAGDKPGLTWRHWPCGEIAGSTPEDMAKARRADITLSMDTGGAETADDVCHRE